MATNVGLANGLPRPTMIREKEKVAGTEKVVRGVTMSTGLHLPEVSNDHCYIAGAFSTQMRALIG